MSYQNITGSLMASGYGKLGTQEAMNDMFVVEGGMERMVHRQRSDTRCDGSKQRTVQGIELYARLNEDFGGEMNSNWDGTQTAPTLTQNNANGAQRMPDKENFNAVTNDVTYVVRRLTPTECARLQGFPDWWTADVPHADSAEYKMWGNGVSLPCVLYVMEGIAKTLRKEEGEQNRIPDNSGNEGDNTA